jgi:hypothetical protein
MKSARFSVPRRVGDLLTAAVPALAERMLAEGIRRDWEATVGGALARRSRPASLDHGVLEIQTDNSPWLMELQMRSGEILEALGRRYGRSVVSLRFALGARPAAAPVPVSRPSRAVARLSAEETREIETVTASLGDPGLVRALRRLLTKDRLARRQQGSISTAEKDQP